VFLEYLKQDISSSCILHAATHLTGRCLLSWDGSFVLLSQVCLLCPHTSSPLTCSLYQRTNLLLNLGYRLLARRGGVKRLSATIYDDIRHALRERLRNVSHSPHNSTLPSLTQPQIMKEVAAILDHAGRKIVTVMDVIYVLNRVCLSLPTFRMYSR
jgi:histone H3/H4